MASCGNTTNSSMMLTYAASSVHSQDLSSSLTSFKTKTVFSTRKTTFCNPLVLQPRGRNSIDWVELNLQREAKYRMVVAALAAEAEVAEPAAVEEKGEEEITGSATLTVKTKRGKIVLPPKRDRVFVAALGVPFQKLVPLCKDGRSKRFLEIQKLRENKREYDLKTAISLLKKMASTKFVEAAEAHFRLNIDPKYSDQQLRATVNLPKGTGQTVRVAVLKQGEKFHEAKNAGADLVGGEELLEQINCRFTDFDKLIASPDMMPKVASLQNFLEPRGLMPNPGVGNVTANISQAVVELKQGRVEYRADKTGIVHLPFGKADFHEDDLLENLIAAIKSVETNKPKGVRGVYWRSAHICSSMGPSIRLNIREILDCFVH